MYNTYLARIVPQVSASIISANFLALGSEIEAVIASGADYIHVDVMDGDFVPNITVGPKMVSDIASKATAPLDVHLMIQKPERYLEHFARAGADIMTVHFEATNQVFAVLKKIKSLNVKAGLAICPGTSEEMLEPFYEMLDWILIMTVMPGFSGQEFIPSQLNKVVQVRRRIDSMVQDIKVAVDGGINQVTAKMAVEAGADVLVAGSYIFGGGDYTQSIATLKQKE